MIIDVNTYIGHWPFRKIRNNTAEKLIEQMDKAGIDKAVVSNLNSIFYKDTQEGNIELISEIKAYGDRFIPLEIINPAYPGWKKDFLTCIDNFGMKGLEMYPYYHNYKLTDEASLELLNLAAEKKIPVHLPCAVENIRQKHWMDTSENLNIQQVEEVLKLCPEVDLIITNGVSHVYARKLKEVTKNRKGRVYYDFCRTEVFEPYFEALVENAGVDRILFASQLPFQYVDTQYVKLYFSKLTEEEKNKILSQNLKDLLSI
jgi:uncharacterized protein